MNKPRCADTNTLMHSEEWGVWIFWIFGVCLIPILITPLFSDRTVTFSSLLAYCFTLLAVNVYVFDHVVESGIEESLPMEKLRKYLGIGVMMASVIVFLLYNYDDSFRTVVNDNIAYAVAGTAVPVFLLAMSLNAPAIRRQANERIAKRERDSIARTKRKAREMQQTIEDEGIR